MEALNWQWRRWRPCSGGGGDGEPQRGRGDQAANLILWRISLGGLGIGGCPKQPRALSLRENWGGGDDDDDEEWCGDDD